MTAVTDPGFDREARVDADTLRVIVPRRKLTDPQIEQLVLWRERGWSYKAIAARLNVSAGAIHYQCLRNAAVSPRQRRRDTPTTESSFVASDGRLKRRFTFSDDQQLLALEAEGLPYGQIAKRMGRALTSVRMRLMTLALRQEMPA